MLINLIRYVSEASSERIPSFLLEDVALCKSYCDSYEGAAEMPQEFSGVYENLGVWKENFILPNVETEGRRQQPLLRELVDKLLDGELPTMPRSELDVIAAVMEIIDSLEDVTPFVNLRNLIHSYSDDVRSRRDTLAASAGLEGLKHEMKFYSSEDIERCRPRSIKGFAGIEIMARGPLLNAPGNVRILDFVPDDCMVVVENGSCWVNGYIIGKVAVSHDCVARDNISGVVVTQQGEIRTRNIINEAFVVSKIGRVFVRNSENPKLIFAGKEIHIIEDCIMGTYTSPRIYVGGAARGGEYNVSEIIEAPRLRHSDTRPLSIALVHKISNEDYGESISREARRVMSHIIRNRIELKNINAKVENAQDDVQHFSQNAILFLLGGDEVKERLMEFEESLQRQSVIKGILRGFGILIEYGEVLLASESQMTQADEADHPLSALDDVESDLEALRQEGKIDRDLILELGRIREMSDKLSGGRVSRKVVLSCLDDLQTVKIQRTKDLNVLNQNLQGAQRELRRKIKQVEMIKKFDEIKEKDVLLGRVLVSVKKLPDSDPAKRRMRAPFFKLLVQHVGKRRDWIAQYKERAEEISAELTTLQRDLETKHQVVDVTGGQGDKREATVKGLFDSGTLICTDRFYLTADKRPPKAVVRMRNCGDEIKCYVRRDGMLVEVSATEEDGP